MTRLPFLSTSSLAMRSWRHVLGSMSCACSVLLLLTTTQIQAAETIKTVAMPATQVQCQSSYLLRLQELEAAWKQNLTSDAKSKLATELGQHLILMGKYQAAHDFLQQALPALPSKGLQTATTYIALGNTEVELGRRDLAQEAYTQALLAAPQSISVKISVGLNQLALKQNYHLTVGAIEAVAQHISVLADGEEKARYIGQLALQSKRVKVFPIARIEADLLLAIDMAEKANAPYVQVEVIDVLMQLMEEQGRDDAVLAWSERAILILQQVDAPELMIAIEARRARLFARHQEWPRALKSYRAAVAYIESIRQDIPVSYAQGKSSLREIIDPVYLGLADTLLKLAEHGGAQENKENKRDFLYQAREVVEQIKQNQLDDYLGNRCSSGSRASIANSAHAGSAGNQRAGAQSGMQLAADTAVLYPVIFPDRLELLLETSSGIERYTVAISAEKLNQDASAFASALRAQQSYMNLARRLHESLLAPLESSLQEHAIKTLVIVPDGVLRLLAFSALHDGRAYAIEKYAIAISPGLHAQSPLTPMSSISSATSRAQANGAKTDNKNAHQVLLAGLSEPGAVVERLPDELVDQLLQNDQDDAQNLRGKAAQMRALRGGGQRGVEQSIVGNIATNAISKEDQAAIAARLREILRLDGVDQEMRGLQSLVSGTTIINQEFTAAQFAQRVRSGQYDIVHVASHGIFGSTADKTFILAHDDVITIDQFQSLLNAEKLKDKPLDLLILSACETAEGDDRAPLGISGAALKAKARSAMGSLWPVSDAATSRLMENVYRYYVQKNESKVQALRLAQLDLMRQSGFAHPSYWAAFIMVGNWQ